MALYGVFVDTGYKFLERSLAQGTFEECFTWRSTSAKTTRFPYQVIVVCMSVVDTDKFLERSLGQGTFEEFARGKSVKVPEAFRTVPGTRWVAPSQRLQARHCGRGRSTGRASRRGTLTTATSPHDPVSSTDVPTDHPRPALAARPPTRRPARRTQICLPQPRRWRAAAGKPCSRSGPSCATGSNAHWGVADSIQLTGQFPNFLRTLPHESVAVHALNTRHFPCEAVFLYPREEARKLLFTSRSLG